VWAPTWTSLDTTDNLVVSYTIDRGRVFEMDQTDGGRATVEILDRDGVLDPTNPGGPHFGLIEPLLQCRLQSWNPVTATMQPRFRGWVSDWTYDFDPGQQVNRLRLELTDIFEVLGAIDMLPYPIFGDDPVTNDHPDSAGQVYYNGVDVQDRITRLLADSGIPDGFSVVFTGNVSIWASIYSVGETPLAAIQEAADAEWPGVSNVYPDRFGRIVFHGREAKFDPAGVLAGVDSSVWDWHHWQAGDGAAVAADLGAVAQLRSFGYTRGVSKIINSAIAYPVGATDAQIAAQIVTDSTSIARYGRRSWSAQNLLTRASLADGSDAFVETQRFAQYYVDNFKQPRDRVDGVAFRSIQLGAPGANVTWQLLTEIDISDRVDLTVSSPGGGGFTAVPYYVEGIHETVRPLNPEMDSVTVELDLSPTAYFDSDPFPP